MRAHDEMEQLSALIDGELPDVERARIEAHVAGCADCRRVLDALRASLADLALLGVTEPSPQDSWALRAAVRRARAPSRWRRASLAMGTAAAALVTVLAIVLSRGGGPGPQLALQQDQLREAAPGASAIPDYDRAGIEVRARDLAASFSSTKGAAPAQAAPASAPLPAELRRCFEAIGDTRDLTLIGTEAATFEQQPAFLYLFRAADRVEIWVMARDRCTVLLFARAPIR
jgi:hypothetical protein